MNSIKEDAIRVNKMFSEAEQYQIAVENRI